MKDISKKIVEGQNKIQDLYDKLKKFKQDHSIKGHKAKFIKCPGCGSQIRVDLLENRNWTDSNNASHEKLEYICPVCRKDMRADYIVAKVYDYETKIIIELIKMYELLINNGYNDNASCKNLKGVKIDYNARGFNRFDNIFIVDNNGDKSHIGSVSKRQDGLYETHLSDFRSSGNERNYVIESIARYDIPEKYPFLKEAEKERQMKYKIYF